MTQDELRELLKEEVKGLISYLTDPTDYDNAIDDAERETGWAMPVTTDFKILWIKNRAKRHLFFYLMSESAHKFKFEQINLQHRFSHYATLIKNMDEEFEKAKLENIHEFAGVDAFKIFGTQVEPGFAYEQETGRDITFDEDQKVLFGPNEND